MMKLVLVYLPVLLILPIQPMEIADPAFIHIKTKQDLEPFDDKIVAFILNDSDNLRTSTFASYALDSSVIKYAYIEIATFNAMRIGYQLTQIVETGTQGLCSVLSDLHVKRGLAIRCAYAHELIALHGSIKNKKDNFALFFDSRDGLRIIEKQSGFDLQKRRLP